MNPIQLEIFRALFTSVAEEMGHTLRRTAFSPNIRERCDYSCAVYEADGRLAAQGDHMPVHLGSMPVAVRRAIQAVPMGPGDAVVLNDPYEGGTHLPDLTLVTPV
ncbi:MAG: hydantoinase B/oxoprolinase family protein, partial [Methylacidiphilaceae bacterium]|nr:hydantoinase B/oxoprolinase family protein [Candidatus Methylacidiphilaceae bacterium]